MNNIVFDGKLVRKVIFTDDFKESLKEHLSGAVVVFIGPERDAVSATCTLMAGLGVNSKYHEARDVVLGVLSWANRDCGKYESFRFSMEAFQVVGLGYLEKELVAQIQGDKCAKFRMWFRQALKQRVLKGKVTIVAVPEHDPESIKLFFGRDLIDQYGLVVDTSEVLEGRRDKKEKFKKANTTSGVRRRSGSKTRGSS